MTTRIQLRRGTSAQWAAANPVLAAGEPGVDLDTGEQRIGDGTTPWADLTAVPDPSAYQTKAALDADVAALIADDGSSTHAAVESSGGSLTGVGVSTAWAGSQAAYDAIGTPDPNTLYFVTG